MLREAVVAHIAWHTAAHILKPWHLIVLQYASNCKSASLVQRTFSGRSLRPSSLKAGADSPGAAFTVNDGNQCINIPAPFTLKGDNFEGKCSLLFPGVSHKIKCQLPTMRLLFHIVLPVPSFPYHFFSLLPLCPASGAL